MRSAWETNGEKKLAQRGGDAGDDVMRVMM
jgi:hypothetical protein